MTATPSIDPLPAAPDSSKFPMLRVEHLAKRYASDSGAIQAVADVSFSVGRGEIYGLIGLSGAGKSTLVRCLNLLERPESGRIYFDDTELTALNPANLRRKRWEIGMIFQHFNLFMQKTVYENIAYPLRLQGWKKDRLDARVQEMLRYIDLAPKAKAWPAELSGGQKQRVAIARALAPRPRLLLSDEGTSALDPETTASILELIRRAVDETGISAIMITHQMEVAKSICDRVGVMENGRLIEENTVENLFLKPREERTRRFIQTLQSEFFGQDDAAPQMDASGRPIADSRRLDYSHLNLDKPLYRLGFAGTNVNRPVISELLRRFHLDVNLLAGNINWLQKERVGYLTVELSGEDADVAAALDWLRAEKIDVEVIR